MARARGAVRDSIISYLAALDREATLEEINQAVSLSLGSVPASSIRSYLNLNVPTIFRRTARGRIHCGRLTRPRFTEYASTRRSGTVRPCSITQIVLSGWRHVRAISSRRCDRPPYSILEYSEKELEKLRRGKGGVWRIPPSLTAIGALRCRALPSSTTRIVPNYMRFFADLASLSAESLFRAGTS